jgi:hypothetical protein
VPRFDSGGAIVLDLVLFLDLAQRTPELKGLGIQGG